MNVMVQGGLVDLIPMNVMVQGGLVDLIPMNVMVQVQQGFSFIYSPSFSVAGVGPFGIDLHFAWQVWHFCTWTVLLRGRRGTL